MSPDSLAIELRVRSFDREFGKCTNREHWLTLYLQLRESGDDHWTASETIRMERQMDERSAQSAKLTPEQHNRFPGGRW